MEWGAGFRIYCGTEADGWYAACPSESGLAKAGDRTSVARSWHSLAHMPEPTQNGFAAMGNREAAITPRRKRVPRDGKMNSEDGYRLRRSMSGDLLIRHTPPGRGRHRRGADAGAVGAALAQPMPV